MNAPVDNRGFLRESDQQLRIRLIAEQGKFEALAKQVELMVAQYGRLLDKVGYPAEDRAFERQYATLFRCAGEAMNSPELLETADAVDPDADDNGEPRNPVVIDERFGACSWVQS